MKTSITNAELKQLFKEKVNILIIDVRYREEYIEKHIPSAINIPIDIIESGNFIPEPDKTLVTVCTKGGGRSEHSANYLRKETKNDVFFLTGGAIGWFENNHSKIHLRKL
jgi:rhodanese-related sulfurtransferase